MTLNIFENPLECYEYLLLGPLSQIYSARKKEKFEGFINYSNLIIDKFAIHSSTFYHISSGIIEHKKSNETVKMVGYDLFSVNSLFRTMIENYATFNHLFVEPESYEEKEFRFLLWKIDGLTDKAKINIPDTNKQELEESLKKDEEILENAISEFENCAFFLQFKPDLLNKIYNKEKKKFSWRFLLLDDDKILQLKISELVKHTCKISAFTNMYRYTSIHTHTNFLALEHFERTRGEIISNQYTDPITRLAINLTCLMIDDICVIDDNARKEFENLPILVKQFISGMSKAIKQS